MRSSITLRRGRLRSVITFKIRPNTQDSAGGVEDLNAATNLNGWATRAEVRGEIEGLRGRETEEGKRTISEEVSLLTINYDSANMPDRTDAVVCEGRRYDIQSIVDVELRHRKVEIVMREVK